MPILTKITETYKFWNVILPNLPRPTRYTLGEKIDNLFTDFLELILQAAYSTPARKRGVLEKASLKLDKLKFFLRLMWEIKGLNDKKYILLSRLLSEIGKMLGGWQKQLMKQ